MMSLPVHTPHSVARPPSAGPGVARPPSAGLDAVPPASAGFNGRIATMRNAGRLTLLMALAAVAAPAPAEILSIRGSAQATITETRFNEAGDRDEVIEQFPETSATLPIRVVADLLAAADELAAARAAVQFADPLELDQPNPEEFAINLALNSVTEHTRYETRARAQEIRELRFTAQELAAAEGEMVPIAGRLFLDGALAVFSTDPTRDLFGANVTVTVRITQTTSMGDDEIFAGSIGIHGGVDGTATASATGQLPTETLILSDLSTISEEFAAFHVLIIPPLNIPYAYNAVVGETFTLTATVEVTAANLEREVGVAALIGTPADALEQVILVTQGDDAAAKMLGAIQSERQNPTGGSIDAPPTDAVPPPLCGLFGFETLAIIPLLTVATLTRRKSRRCPI